MRAACLPTGRTESPSPRIPRGAVSSLGHAGCGYGTMGGCKWVGVGEGGKGQNYEELRCIVYMYTCIKSI